MNEYDTRALPELGTREAALRSVVNLISRATGQPEELLAYWLDLYYQVRSRRDQEPAPYLKPALDAAAAQAAAIVKKELAAESFEAQPAEAAPPEPSAPPPPEGKPSKPAKEAGAAAAAKFTRTTLIRLQAARKEGLPTPQIVQLAEGNITEDQVRDILAAKPVPVAVYRVLAAALDRRERHE